MQPASKQKGKQNIGSDRSKDKKENEDIFQEIVIGEEDYPLLLYELNENALNLIYNENYERASMLLQKAAIILDKQKPTLAKSKKNASIVLLTHHNFALCYQKYI